MLNLNCVKNSEKFWVPTKIRETEIIFSEEDIYMANNSIILRINHNCGSGKRIPLFAGGKL
jgi:hypothetical protein